jgi:hypothetical protein
MVGRSAGRVTVMVTSSLSSCRLIVGRVASNRARKRLWCVGEVEPQVGQRVQQCHIVGVRSAALDRVGGVQLGDEGRWRPMTQAGCRPSSRDCALQFDFCADDEMLINP